MARFMLSAQVTPEYYQGLITNPVDRGESVKPMLATINATLEHYWLGIGDNTIYAVFTAPDNDVDIQAFMMLVHSSGITTSISTTRLLTSAEASEAAKRAKQLTYRPPSA